jgi:hypothetical protein
MVVVGNSGMKVVPVISIVCGVVWLARAPMIPNRRGPIKGALLSNALVYRTRVIELVPHSQMD